MAEPVATTPPPALGPDELGAVAELWRRSGRELLARFGGSSMEPTIPAAAEVLLRCADAPAVGDVVAFLREGKLVVHRLVGTGAGGGWWLTRGDAHAVPDVPIPRPQEVFGLVTAVRRGEELLPLPAAPRSLAGRLALGAASGALRVHPRVGQAMVKLLLLPRFVLGLARRVASGGHRH